MATRMERTVSNPSDEVKTKDNGQQRQQRYLYVFYIFNIFYTLCLFQKLELHFNLGFSRHTTGSAFIFKNWFMISVRISSYVESTREA